MNRMNHVRAFHRVRAVKRTFLFAVRSIKHAFFFFMFVTNICGTNYVREFYRVRAVQFFSQFVQYEHNSSCLMFQSNMNSMNH